MQHVAGSEVEGYKYSGSNNIDEVAWYVKNYQEDGTGEMKTTHPVGLKSPMSWDCMT